MKKQIGMICMLTCLMTGTAISQLQRGNVLIGADLANIGINLNKGGNFSLGIQPKAALVHPRQQSDWRLPEYPNDLCKRSRNDASLRGWGARTLLFC